MEETRIIEKFDDLPIIVSEAPTLDDVIFGGRYPDDADFGQEFKLASSRWGPSGFADIGLTVGVFVRSVVPPDT